MFLSVTSFFRFVRTRIGERYVFESKISKTKNLIFQN